MKRKLSSVIISIILALSTAIILPVQVAAKTPTYIKDVIICTGSQFDEVYKKINAKGYTPIQKNLNKGNSTVVVMGYLPTENKDEAITDLAAMTEKSGYSFGQYKDILQEKEQTVSDLVNKFKVAIEEFRENYAAEEPSAIVAYEMLNVMTNDDMNNIGLGDMFISEDTTDEQLKVVFMQSRTEIIASIEQYLAIACSSNPWMTELEDLDTDGVYEPSIADDARCIYNTLDSFQKKMNQFLELGIDENTTEEEIIAFNDSCTENEKNVFMSNYPAFLLLKKTTYLEHNLFDLLMSDLESLDMTLLYPMASIMTRGQLATFEYIPFSNSVANNVMNEEDWKKQFEDVKKLDEFGNLETISVFSGVDRTIFNPEGIAVTSKALLHEHTTAESLIKPQKLIEKSGEIVGTLMFTGIILAMVGVYFHAEKNALALKFTVKAVNAMTDFSGYASDAVYNATLAKYTAVFSKISGVLFGLAIASLLIIMAVILINRFVDCYKHPKYSEMPRIIVDIDVTKSEEYIYYYCAKDINGNLADVNAWNGEKWTGIYYTKDPDAGKPLTTESLVNYGLSNSAAPVSADKSYRAVHYFGESAAYNLNRNSDYKNTIDKDNYVYMYFVEDASAATASIFSTKAGYGLSGFAGLAIGSLATALLIKGKKKKQEPVAE